SSSLFSHDPHHDLHSFPTRRSSDLNSRVRKALSLVSVWKVDSVPMLFCSWQGMTGVSSMPLALLQSSMPFFPIRAIRLSTGISRSEEHTSELQSRENLVCRLLLEKK